MTTLGDEQEAKAISRLIERLAVRFPQIPARTVEETVSSAHQAFEGARVRGFVPLLVEHDVLIQLKNLAKQADQVVRQAASTPHRVIDPVMTAWAAGDVPMQEYPAGGTPPGPSE